MLFLIHLYKLIIILYNIFNFLFSKIREYCFYEYSLTPSLLIEVPVPYQERDRSYICVRGIHFVSDSTIFPLDL